MSCWRSYKLCFYWRQLPQESSCHSSKQGELWWAENSRSLSLIDWTKVKRLPRIISIRLRNFSHRIIFLLFFQGSCAYDYNFGVHTSIYPACMAWRQRDTIPFCAAAERDAHREGKLDPTQIFFFKIIVTSFRYILLRGHNMKNKKQTNDVDVDWRQCQISVKNVIKRQFMLIYFLHWFNWKQNRWHAI